MANTPVPNGLARSGALKDSPLTHILQSMYNRTGRTDELREKTLKEFAKLNIMSKARWAKNVPTTMFEGGHVPGWAYLQPTLPEMDHWSAWRGPYNGWDIVSQPYSSGKGLLGLLHEAHKRGLFVSFAPDLFSSIHYPGRAVLFVVRTRCEEVRWPWWHQGTGWTERALTGTGPVAAFFGDERHERNTRAGEMLSIVNHYREHGVDRSLLIRLHEHELSAPKYNRPVT